ncbi:MAG: DMT family transporter [Acidobacteriaceae bacterium]|nr:DMT family transporter [Acidobacteriaceae bacterium]
MIAREKAPARWQADLALAAVAFVWGTTFVVVKSALPHISMMYFLAVRFGLASACMLAMFLPAFRGTGAGALWRGFRGGAAAGLFLWLGYVLQTGGLKYTSAGNSGFLTGLYIVLVPLISAGMYRRWPQARELIGIAVATAGMVIMTLPYVDAGFRMNRGDVLTLGCAVAFAFHLLVLGYYSQREKFQAVALGQIACAAVLSGLSLLFEPPRVVWSRGVIGAIILTAIFATAVAFALQTWGQQYTTATRTALIFALEPVFALATAVAVGGERLTVSSLAGGAFILTGILAVELKPGLQVQHPT